MWEEGAVEHEKNEKKSKITSALISEPGIYWNPGMSAQSCIPLCFGHKVNIVVTKSASPISILVS